MIESAFFFLILPKLRSSRLRALLCLLFLCLVLALSFVHYSHHYLDYRQRVAEQELAVSLLKHFDEVQFLSLFFP